MRKNQLQPLALILYAGLACTFFANVSAQTPHIALEEVASGLPSPTSVTNAGDGSGRLFMTTQPGTILIYDGTSVLATPFLDLSSIITTGGESGLLSVAFHPAYETNGLFYVNYTDINGDTVVARYQVSADANIADLGSAEILLTIEQPDPAHNGGQLQFGPDGYLYIGTGDGGGAGDPFENAQDPTTLLGKMLRIDVNGSSPYSIPADNPFVNDPGTLNEIWALGFRNPWRFSFDRLTGDLWTTDVGQEAREEVNVQAAASPGGENYGWDVIEGSICHEPATGCDPGGLVVPVMEYDHTEGRAITGGYRYRGTAHPSIDGMYFFADFISGTIWGGRENADGTWTRTALLNPLLALSSFGEDESGELYAVHLGSGGNGILFRLVTAPLCEIESAQSVYMNGQPIRMERLRFANPGADSAQVEFKVWTGHAADGPNFSVLNIGAAGGFVLAPEFDNAIGPVNLLAVDASTPRGIWHLGCRMLDPITGAVLSRRIVEFEVQ